MADFFDNEQDFLENEAEQLKELGIEEDFQAVGIDDGGFTDGGLVVEGDGEFPTEVNITNGNMLNFDNVGESSTDDFMNEFTEDQPSTHFTEDQPNHFTEDQPSTHFTEDQSDPVMEAPAPVIESSMQRESPQITQWKEERETTLRGLDEAEISEQAEWLERAKKELADWTRRNNEQTEKIRSENRVSEKVFIEEMTETRPGSEWEKVSSFCDFNPASSQCSKDVSRMRSMLLQLKQAAK